MWQTELYSFCPYLCLAATQYSRRESRLGRTRPGEQRVSAVQFAFELLSTPGFTRKPLATARASTLDSRRLSHALKTRRRTLVRRRVFGTPGGNRALGGRAPVNSGCPLFSLRSNFLHTIGFHSQTARSRSRLHPRFPPPFSCIKNTPTHSCAAACFWYSRRESNPQRPLRRGLLYPFNYGSILNCFPPTSLRL